MIVENVIKFGYGDIGVGSKILSLQLKVTPIKPPQEIGTNLSDCEDVEIIGNPIYFELEKEEDYIRILTLLKSVKNKEITSFEVGSYIFDFSNYNVKSIEVCEYHVSRLYSHYFFLSAC